LAPHVPEMSRSDVSIKDGVNSKPIQSLRMLNKRIVQNGFYAQTLQAQISQDVSEWYVFFS